VSNPAPQGVWQTCRWNTSFTYTLSGLTPGASYTLKLDWAELTWTSAGKREFNVTLNGSLALTNFDVYATGGYKRQCRSQFTVKANSSGQIVIAFTQEAVDNPFVSGIGTLYGVGMSRHFPSFPHRLWGKERKMTPETLDRRNPALRYLKLCMLKGNTSMEMHSHPPQALTYTLHLLLTIKLLEQR